MYCAAEVASAAPAIPQPRPNMRKMSSPKLTKLESTDASSGVLQLKTTLSKLKQIQ